MAGTAWYSARVIRRYANKAQQVILAAAVFDKQGRVLVSPDGLLPSERITASLVERSQQDSFTEAHPLFHWMFRASRNWESITSLVPGMASHLLQLPRTTRDSSTNAVRLIDEHGEVIDNYDTVVKELFCTAAVALADQMKVRLTSVGLLWHEILPTGSPAGSSQRRQREVEQILEEGHKKGGAVDATTSNGDDLAEKGVPQDQSRDLGRGSLMFLVRRVESARDVEALEAAGYRFAELHQVSGIIKSSMQIKSRNVEGQLKSMAEYGQERPATAEGGVQLGFFGIRARVGSHGFDVLVQQGHGNRLPTVSLPLERLEPWHSEFLGQFDRMTPHGLSRALDALASRLTARERRFAAILEEGLKALQVWVDDTVFDEATLTSRVVQIPRRGTGEASGPDATTSLIAFRIVIPIHLQTLSTTRCKFVPLGLFRVQQLVYRDSPHHLTFSRAVHREMLPVLASAPPGNPGHRGTMPPLRDSGLPSRFRRLRRPGPPGTTVDAEGNPIPTKLHRSSSPAPSTRSGSTLKLWNGQRSNSSATEIPSPGPEGRSERGRKADGSAARPPPNPFGRIMVSQEITVQVHDGQHKARAQTLAFRTPDAEQENTAQGGGRRDRGGGGGGGEQLGVTSTAMADDVGRSGRAESAIELRPLQQGTANAGGGREMATFVDELLAVCVDGR